MRKQFWVLLLSAILLVAFSSFAFAGNLSKQEVEQQYQEELQAEKIAHSPAMARLVGTPQGIAWLNELDVVSDLVGPEPFDGPGIPANWENIELGDAGFVWVNAVDVTTDAFDDLTGGFMYMDSDDAGSGHILNARLVTPSFDATGVFSLMLTFDSEYNDYGDQYAKVQVSTDGGTTWEDVADFTADHSAAQTVDLSAYAGSADVKVGFEYYGSYDYYWGIDNVHVVGDDTDTFPPTVVVKNALAETYIGQNLDLSFVITDPSVVDASTAVFHFVDWDEGENAPSVPAFGGQVDMTAEVDTFTATLPSESFAEGQMLGWYLTVADDLGNAGRYPAEDGTYNTVEVVNDEDEPDFEIVSAPAYLTVGTPETMTVMAADDNDIGFVKLNYMEWDLDSGEAVDGGVSGVASFAASGDDDDLFTLDIPGDIAPAMTTLAWYVTYEDDWSTPNEGRDPADEEDFYFLNVFDPAPFFEDFEAGQGAWASSDETIWQFGTPVGESQGAYSGTNAWATVLDDDYPSDADATLTSPEYTLGFGGIFSYAVWQYSETGWDGFNVEATTDGGVTWEIVHPFGDYNEDYSVGSYPNYEYVPFFSMRAGAWRTDVYDLSAYNEQTVQLRFNFHSDGSSSYYGVVIDDIMLYDATMGGIGGVVTDLATTDPLEGVLVQAKSGSTVVAEVTTDVDGAYSMGIDAGTYTLAATKAAYADTTVAGVVVELNTETPANIAMRPQTEKVPVKGHVFALDGETPIPNAAVSVIEPNVLAFTDADGYFESADSVLIGSYTVAITNIPVGSQGYHDVTLADVEFADGSEKTFDMEDVLPPEDFAVNVGDAQVELTWAAPLNHVDEEEIEHEISDLEGLERALTSGDKVGNLEEIQNRLNVLRNLRALNEQASTNELNDLMDFVGYIVYVNGERWNDEPIVDESVVVDGLANGREFTFKIAADYGYNPEYFVFAEAPAVRPLPVQGYVYDVNETMEWVEIRTNDLGTATGFDAQDDVATDMFTFAEGNTFNFFGVSYSQLNIGSNGYITFVETGTRSDYSENPIPDPSTPNGIIAPLWNWMENSDSDDYDCYYYYDSENNLYIVTWYAPEWNTTNIIEFQSIMNLANGTITFNYNSTSAGTWPTDDGDGSIGIENETGTTGTAYLDGITDGLSLTFGLDGALYGNLQGTITHAAGNMEAIPAAVKVIGSGGTVWRGMANEEGFYEILLVDRFEAPYTVELMATGYDDAIYADVAADWTDGFVYTADFTMNAIDPATPPLLSGFDGYYDNGVELFMREPGTNLETADLQLDDGIINNGLSWRTDGDGYSTDSYFAAKFEVTGGVGVTLENTELGIHPDHPDAIFQELVLTVFADNGEGEPGEILYEAAPQTVTADDLFLRANPGIPVTGTFFVGFAAVDPTAGADALAADAVNNHNAFWAKHNNEEGWFLAHDVIAIGDPIARATVSYIPTGEVEEVELAINPGSTDVNPVVASNSDKMNVNFTTVAMASPFWGLTNSYAAPYRPTHQVISVTNELDELLGYNLEYTTDLDADPVVWVQANTEGEILEDNFFVELGSENENTPYFFRANALVVDPLGGPDVTSDWSDTLEVVFNMSPEAPAPATAVIDGANPNMATVDWTIPDANEDGSEIVDLAGFKVYNAVTDAVIIDALDATTTTASYTTTAPFEVVEFVVKAHDEVPNMSAAAVAGRLILGTPGFSEGFEGAEIAFELNGVWELGEPTAGPGAAYEGTNVIATVLGGDYAQNNLDDWAIMTGELVVAADDAFISYYHWYESETNWDGYQVKISIDNGATWSPLEPEGGYPSFVDGSFNGTPAFAGNTNDNWQNVVLPMGAYNGQVVKIAFRFRSDGSNMDYYGVAIDNMIGFGLAEPNYATITTGDDNKVFYTDEDDQQVPVQNVAVGVVGEDAPRTMTDADGHFNFEIIGGTYSLWFKHDLFWDTILEDVVVADGELKDLADDIELLRPVVAPSATSIELTYDIQRTEEGYVHSEQTTEFTVENTGTGHYDYTSRAVIAPTMTSVPVNPADLTFSSEVLGKNPVSDESQVGPVVSELDDVWDVLYNVDCVALTGSGALIGAYVVGDHLYVNDFSGTTSLFQIDYTQDPPVLLNTFQPFGGVVMWNETDLDPNTGMAFSIAADQNLYTFSPDGSNAQSLGSVGHDAWGIAYDYDASRAYFADPMGDGSFGYLDLATGQVTTLATAIDDQSAYALAYMPGDPEGFTIYASYRLAEGSVIYRYNPSTEAWSAEGELLVPGAAANSGVGGMSVTNSVDAGRNDIVALVESDPDYAVILEGHAAGADWIWVTPDAGTIDAGASQVFTLHALWPEDHETFPYNDGDSVTGNIVISGPHAPDINIPFEMVVTIGVDDAEVALPTQYALYQNYPNPFNPSTDIKFDLVETQNVKLTVYNMLGQEVTRLVNTRMEAGFHKVSFNASQLASGVYFYRIETEKFSAMKKMVMVK